MRAMQGLSEQQVRQIIGEEITQNASIIELRKTQQQHGVTIDCLVTEQHRQATEMGRLATEQHRQGVFMESMRDDIKLIAEAVSPLLSRLEKMQSFENALTEQGDQITVTKSALAKHVRDQTLHLPAK